MSVEQLPNYETIEQQVDQLFTESDLAIHALMSVVLERVRHEGDPQSPEQEP